MITIALYNNNQLFLWGFLGEDPEQKVSLLTRLKGTRNNNVAAWIQVISLMNLPSISETAWGSSAIVIVYVLLVNRLGIVIRGLQEWGEA